MNTPPNKRIPTAFGNNKNLDRDPNKGIIKRKRPDIAPKTNNYPLAKSPDSATNDFEIPVVRTVTSLPDDEYRGIIENMEKWIKANGKEKMTITFQLENVDFKNTINFPPPSFSPFNEFFALLAGVNDSTIGSKKAIGLPVIFETKIVITADGAEFCNIKWIEIDEDRMAEISKTKTKAPAPDPIDEDDSDDVEEYEKEDLSSYFNDDEEDDDEDDEDEDDD